MDRAVGFFGELCRSNKSLNTLAQYAYLNFYRPPSYWTARVPATDLKRPLSPGTVRVMFLCDEMTWQDFSGCCDPMFLRPDIWKKQFESFMPDLFFCESAWSGAPPVDGCWRGRVYKNEGVHFENRRELLAVLKYCEGHNVPTVFWNKEDPVFFEHARYNFTDTALRFDRVLTVSEECVPRYESLGCKNVDVFPFSVNTDMFHPTDKKPIPGTAVFAGSWFGDQPQRCQELSSILDYAISRKWELTIYDRHSASPEKRFRFPKKYQPYIHDALPFERMPDAVRGHEWALNVNTVKNSRTAFSRRILQMLACGVKVLTPVFPGAGELAGALTYPHPENQGYLEIVCSDFDLLEERYSSRSNFEKALGSVRGKSFRDAAVRQG